MTSQQPIPSSLFDSFSAANWIWTPEPWTVVGNIIYFPAGSRAFRGEYKSATQVSSALILIACDDFFTLYINGNEVGRGTLWSRAEVFAVALTSESNIFAVNATNDAPKGLSSPAGLRVAIQINFADGTTPDFFVSDTSWRTAGVNMPLDFASPSLVDTASWVPARSIPASSGKWGALILPTTISEDLSFLPPTTVSSVTASATQTQQTSTSTSPIISPTTTTTSTTTSTTTTTDPVVSPIPTNTATSAPVQRDIGLIVGTSLGALGLLVTGFFILVFVRHRKTMHRPLPRSPHTAKRRTGTLEPFPVLLPQPGQLWDRGYTLGAGMFGREKTRDGDVLRRALGASAG